MTEVRDMSKVFSSINEILSKSNIDNVSSESVGFQELPDGYYLCEVIDAALTESKTSGLPMTMLAFKVVEDGFAPSIDGGWTVLNKTKNRQLRKYWTFKDENSVQRFVSDMLKFEGETEGESLLSKEYFTSAELVEEAIQLLVGLRIFIQLDTTEKDDGSKSQWSNLVSWKRAAKLELPM